MGKRIAFPGSYYDTRRLESWLSQRAAEGLRFYKFSSLGKITTFERREPQRIRYYVEPDFDQYTPEEMEKAYKDLGWTFVEELRGTCLVYESEDPWASRPSGRFEERDWAKKWRRLLLGQLAAILLSFVSFGLILLQPFFNRAAMAEEHWFLVAALLGLTAVYIVQQLCPLAASFYDIHVWNRCIRMGEETDEWRGMVILRWGEVILIWLLLIMLPLIWIGAFPSL